MPPVCLVLELRDLPLERDVLHADADQLAHGRGRGVGRNLDGDLGELFGRLLPGPEHDQSRLLDLGGITEHFRFQTRAFQARNPAAVEHVEMKSRGRFHERATF